MRQIDLQNQLDRKDRQFIDAVQYFGGEATTTQIRGKKPLSRSETNHRFRKLEELGLIEITQADVGHGDREPPKIAHLTGKARAAIERGILRGIDTSRSNEELNDLQSENRALREEVDELRSMIHAVTETLRQHDDRIDDIEHDITEVVYPWMEMAEDEIRANRQACRGSEKTSAKQH